MGSKKPQEGPSLPARRTKSSKAVRWVAMRLEAKWSHYALSAIDTGLPKRWRWWANNDRPPYDNAFGCARTAKAAMRAAEKAARAMVAR